MWKLIIVLTIIVALWTVLFRPWLRHKPWMEWFFSNPVVEWIEIHIYRKSEMLAWSRYLSALGGILTAIAQIDPSVVSMFEPLLPEDWKWVARVTPLVITLAGLMGEPLRRDISKPIEQVELPALVTANVAVAMIKADEAKAELIAEAKAMPDAPADVPLVKAPTPVKAE